MSRAFPGMLYARSWYLDTVAAGWEALVLDDYRAVFPLCVRRKWGVAYLYQPPFCQQLGIFSSETDEAIVRGFLDAIPSPYRWVDIHLNSKNRLTLLYPGETISEKPNYRLSLTGTGEEIRSGFHAQARRNLKKAIKQGLFPTAKTGVREVINIYISHISKKVQGIGSNEIKIFERLAETGAERQALEVAGIADPAGALCAGAVFFREKQTLYYLMGAANEKGRSANATSLLFADLIDRYAGSGIVLDFEGSSIPGIARFYKDMGAAEAPYFHYRRNRLPFPFNLLKNK